MIEVVDGSKHSVGLIARAMSQGMSTKPSLTAADSSAKAEQETEPMTEEAEDTIDVDDLNVSEGDRGLGISLQESEEDAKSSKKIWNATARRRGAFRRGLVRCVMLKHEAYLKSLGQQSQEHDPLKEGRWHEKFPVASLSLAGLLKAAQEAAEQLADSEKSGRIK